ncbi:MAG: hypothetical protein R3B48_19655 [Kofleriaceae bacterium]
MTSSRIQLGAFDAKLRRRTALRWPEGALGPEVRVELVEGASDLLLLDHTPSRRFSGREPVHQSLMIELSAPLEEALAAGAPPAGRPLTWRRLVYRAGTERVTYQATAAMGSIVLLEMRGDAVALQLELRLVAELDVEGVGSRQLDGVVLVPVA